MKLFFDFTAPSIHCQSDQDFTWILKAHPRTPTWARKLLDEGHFEVCYDEFPPHREVNNQASYTFATIIRRMTSDREIITTRIDSDDAMSVGHIAGVKKHIRPNQFFDYSRGIVRNKHGIFIHWKPKVSQFCSLFEIGDEIRTVYHKYHIDITLSECLKNQTDWGWCQVNHGSNITNGILRDSPHFTTRDKEYPYQATQADWDTINQNYPFLKDCHKKDDRNAIRMG